jgi:hypothetical protein
MKSFGHAFAPKGLASRLTVDTTNCCIALGAVMGLREAYEFDYWERMVETSRQRPLTNLTQAVTEQLMQLSDRAIDLEQSIFGRLLSAALLGAVALLLFFTDVNGLWVMAAGMAAFCGLSAGEMLVIKRRTVADIEQFEKRLSGANYGVKWTPTSPRKSKKMQVRIFWRESSPA